jgi:hypothetical protein
MGRATEFIEYINRHPRELGADFMARLTHITITPELKQARSYYRNHLKQQQHENGKTD